MVELCTKPFNRMEIFIGTFDWTPIYRPAHSQLAELGVIGPTGLLPCRFVNYLRRTMLKSIPHLPTFIKKRQVAAVHWEPSFGNNCSGLTSHL